MKQITTIFYLSLFLTVCSAQTKNSDHSNTIKEQAAKMGQFLLKKDYKSFCKYTYPEIIEMMGGKKKMIKELEKTLAEMLSKGSYFLNVSFGEPSKIITIGKELQCTVPQTLELKVLNGKLIIKSTLIAITINNGKKWYFVDTSSIDIQTLKRVLPNLSEELIIPKKTQPTFYEE